MKLLVNTTALTPPLTGIGHYCSQLMLQLMDGARLDNIKGVSLSGTQLVDRAALEATIRQAQNGHAENAGAQLRGGWRNLARQIPFARSVRRSLVKRCLSSKRAALDGYVYWEPNFLRLPVQLPSAVTIYDLSHHSHPEFHPSARVRLLEKGIARSVAGADRVIAISEFTRQEVIRTFSLPPEKVALVQPAVSDAFRVEPTVEAMSALRLRYALPERFVLSVGTLEPRKNTIALMRAFAALPADLRKSCPLVLVGGKGWHTHQIDADLTRLEQRGELIWLGYVPQSDMPLLYRAADAMAYVSLYEGYGMPVAEAMVSGTPVLTSDCTSMPEVAAGSALLVNPRDDEAVRDGLERILSDQLLRQQCIERGLKQADSYTWQNAGDQLMTVLRELQN